MPFRYDVTKMVGNTWVTVTYQQYGFEQIEVACRPATMEEINEELEQMRIDAIADIAAVVEARAGLAAVSHLF